MNNSTYSGEKTSESFATNKETSYPYVVACLTTAFLAVWIILLNGIVINTLLCRKIYKDVTDYFVSSLSIADMATGVVLLYVTSYSWFQYQNVWECLFRLGITGTVSLSSFGHIFAITIDRFVKIKSPLKYFTLFTKKTVILISSSIWFFSTTIGLLPILGWYNEYRSDDSGDTVCRFFGILPNGYFILNLAISLIFSFGTLCLYLCIILMAIQRQRKMKTFADGQPCCAAFSSNTWKLVQTVAIIVIFSNLCWAPGMICIGLHVGGYLDNLSVDTRGEIITYSGITILLNAFINPLIYAVKIGDVRRRFKHLFCGEKHR